jgi:hypothetical protein
MARCMNRLLKLRVTAVGALCANLASLIGTEQRPFPGWDLESGLWRRRSRSAQLRRDIMTTAASQPAAPYPLIKQAIGLLLLNLLLHLAIALPLYAAVPALEKHPAVDGIIELVSVGCVLWAGQRMTAANLREVFALGRIAWSMAVPLALERPLVGGGQPRRKSDSSPAGLRKDDDGRCEWPHQHLDCSR